MKKIHILLVDDEQENLDLLVELYLDAPHYVIKTAQSVEEANEQLDKHFFDVIVADMRMDDDDDGFRILKEVQDRSITSNVIILTVNDTVEDCRRAFKEGAWDYIQKNVENGSPFKMLIKSIADAMDYVEKWGSHKDKQWVENNMASLVETHRGEYVAVINRSVVTSADTRHEVETWLKERQLPLVLTYITKIDYDAFFHDVSSDKLIVFVEGPTDVEYLKKAMQLRDKHDLLKKIHVITIGSPDGKISGGETVLKAGFAFLRGKRTIKNHVLFLFDHDVKPSKLPNKGEDYENLHVANMPVPPEDMAGINGIEGYFFNAMLDEFVSDGYVRKDVHTTKCGDDFDENITYKIKGKVKLCYAICHERENTATDFQAFEHIITIIEKYVKLHVTQNG